MVTKAKPKRVRSAAETARLKGIREKFQKERPSLESLVDSGQYDVVPQGHYLGLLKAFAELKRLRQQKKLSLADVSKRSGIDKAALSRLENGQNVNPTVLTLESIARAIGVELQIVLKETK